MTLHSVPPFSPRGRVIGPHARAPLSKPARNEPHPSLRASHAVPLNEDEIENSLDRSIHCATCATYLTHSKHAIRVDAAHEHSFVNPQGYLYRIRCFGFVDNVSSAGEPSREFTWFSGYAWTVLLCRQCSQHVGWQFDAVSARFYVLIVDRVVD